MYSMSYEELLARAHGVSRRYQQFRSRFSEFYGLASELAASAGPVPGIVVEPHLDADHFDVVFAGRRVRFAFVFALTSDGATAGTVECRLLKGDVVQLVHLFGFDGNGITNAKPPRADEPLALDVRSNVWYLILCGLLSALEA